MFEIVMLAILSMSQVGTSQVNNLFHNMGYPYIAPAEKGFDSLNVSFVGNWPFGPAFTIDYDSSRHVGYLGSGGGVIILDMSDVNNPQEISNLRTRGYIYGGICHADSILFVADMGGGLYIYNVRDLNSPVLLSVIPAPEGSEFYDVLYSEGLLYISDFHGKYFIYNVSNPSDPVFIDTIRTSYNGGNGMFLRNHYLYVADGDSGLTIIDVRDPHNPQKLTSVNATWAMDVYVEGNYAYVAAGDSGLFVFNVSDPSNPFKIAQYTGHDNENAWRLKIRGNFAYIASEGLEIVDISNPSQPSLISFELLGRVNDLYLSSNYVFIPIWINGLLTIDVSNVYNPSYVSSYNFYSGGYRNVTISGIYALIDDIYGRIWILNINNIENPYLVGQYYTPLWFPTQILVNENFAYITEEKWNDSLQRWVGRFVILDISDIGNPQEVSTYQTPDCACGLYLSGNYAYIAEAGEGLRIVDISDANNPREVGSYDTPGCACKTYVSGNYAFVADGDSGLRIIDISDVTNPYEVGHCYAQNPIFYVQVSGNHAFVKEYNFNTYQGYLDVVSLDDVSNPYLIGRVYPGNVNRFYISGDYAYITDWNELKLVDISNINNPNEVGHYYAPGFSLNGVTVAGNHIFVATWTAGLQIYRNLLLSINENSPKNGSAPLVRYTNGTLTLVLSSNLRASVKIYDITGRLILNDNFNLRRGKNYIHLTLPAGVYFYKLLLAGKEQEVGRFIVIK